MQEQGVRPDDPEFLKAHNLLQALRTQSQYRQAQQQRQTIQESATNGQATTNGIDGK